MGYLPSLDALRGIAVLMVIAQHSGGPRGAGQVGVTLFFVLSGYLITSILRAKEGVSLRAFYARRVRRLAPALAVMLAGVLAWYVVAGVELTGIVAVLLYVGNWAHVAGVNMPGLQHTWSLAVEEQFYLVWPVLFVVGVRRRWDLERLVWVGIGASYVSALWGSDFLVIHGSPERAKDILLGVALAFRTIRPSALVAGGAAASLVLACFVKSTLVTALLVPVPCAVVVAWLAAHPAALAWRPLTFTGRISYGLYVYHYPLSTLFVGVSWLVLVPLSYLVAVASWFGLERRFLRRAPELDALDAEQVAARAGVLGGEKELHPLLARRAH